MADFEEQASIMDFKNDMNFILSNPPFKFTVNKEPIEPIEYDIMDFENNMKFINNDCSRMNQHIEFVEKTYSLARTPLNFVKNKIEYIMNGKETNSELPHLEYK